MNTYSIEADGHGSFKVRITTPDGGVVQIVGGFATERKAEDWVNEQIRLALRTTNASDVA